MVKWRCAGSGTLEVFLVKSLPDGTAKVASRVGRRGWAKRVMVVDLADLFDTREDARQEFRRRLPEWRKPATQQQTR